MLEPLKSFLTTDTALSAQLWRFRLIKEDHLAYHTMLVDLYTSLRDQLGTNKHMDERLQVTQKREIQRSTPAMLEALILSTMRYMQHHHIEIVITGFPKRAEELRSSLSCEMANLMCETRMCKNECKAV
jgi:hypothetical protein